MARYGRVYHVVRGTSDRSIADATSDFAAALTLASPTRGLILEVTPRGVIAAFDCTGRPVRR